MMRDTKIMLLCVFVPILFAMGAAGGGFAAGYSMGTYNAKLEYQLQVVECPMGLFPAKVRGVIGCFGENPR